MKSSSKKWFNVLRACALIIVAALAAISSSHPAAAFSIHDGHQHLAKKLSPEGSTHYLYGKNGRLYGC